MYLVRTVAKHSPAEADLAVTMAGTEAFRVIHEVVMGRDLEVVRQEAERQVQPITLVPARMQPVGPLETPAPSMVLLTEVPS